MIHQRTRPRWQELHGVGSGGPCQGSAQTPRCTSRHRALPARCCTAAHAQWYIAGPRSNRMAPSRTLEAPRECHT
eukprot:3574158-Rhodomonas_salina.1